MDRLDLNESNLMEKSIGLQRVTTQATVVPTKSDSDVILCLQLLSKIPMCTLHLT